MDHDGPMRAAWKRSDVHWAQPFASAYLIEGQDSVSGLLNPVVVRVVALGIRDPGNVFLGPKNELVIVNEVATKSYWRRLWMN